MSCISVWKHEFVLGDNVVHKFFRVLVLRSIADLVWNHVLLCAFDTNYSRKLKKVSQFDVSLLGLIPEFIVRFFDEHEYQQKQLLFNDKAYACKHWLKYISTLGLWNTRSYQLYAMSHFDSNTLTTCFTTDHEYDTLKDSFVLAFIFAPIYLYHLQPNQFRVCDARSMFFYNNLENSISEYVCVNRASV